MRSEELLEGWKDIEQMPHYQSLPYMQIICPELISKHYDNPLAGHFGIKTTRELKTPIGGSTYLWIL